MTTATLDQNQPKQPPQAGEAAILARRYALALYNLAAEQRAVDQVTADVTGLQKLLRESAPLDHVISDPRVTTAQMTKALESVTAGAQFSKITGNFLGLVAQKRRASLLPRIVLAFQAERARRAGEILADVTVARPLSAAQQALLTQHLSAATGGKKITLAVHEDPELIGGFVVQFGSHRIDASLKGKLAALAQHLKEAA